MTIYNFGLFSIVDGFNAIIDVLQQIVSYIGKLFEGVAYIVEAVASFSGVTLYTIMPPTAILIFTTLVGTLTVLAVLRWIM